VPCYDRALELDSEFVLARVNRGLANLELGHPDKALADLQRALDTTVQSPAVMAAHAEALSRVGRQEEAEESFSKLIRTSPGDTRLLVARGFSRIEKDHAGAAADFSQALKLDPKNARAYLGRAYLLRGQDLHAALALVDRAITIEPDFGDGLQLRALIRARLNDPGAELDVERIVTIPTPQRLYNAACALSLLNRTKSDVRLTSKALDYLQRALEAGIPPSYPVRDPDLEPLKHSPRFTKLVGSAVPSG
jgi:tetratricopeptide (TPR) repeat protein